MSDDLRSFQRAFFKRLRDRPLDLTVPADALLYEPLHEHERDPVVRLHDTIEFSASESVQIVAGFRGTGKTTEFSRLEQRLWASDYFVVRVDLDAYLDLHSPLHITEFLLVLAGAIAERMGEERLLGSTAPSFWERAAGLLDGVPEVDAVSLDAGPVGLKIGLKVDRTLRERVRAALSGQLPRLVHEVRTHHERLLAGLSERWGRDARLVVIVDSLEHIRGHMGRSTHVFRSMQELLFGHSRHLQLPGTHMVLSVPASLAMQADNLAAQFVNGAVQSWSSCRVAHRDGREDRETLDRLVRLVDRRGDWRRLVPDRRELERLCLASGGYLRDLLNMLVECIHLAGAGVAPSERVDRVLAVQSRAYQPLYADEIAVLRKIAERRGLDAVTVSEQDYVVRFLDSHLVLCYLDECFWYDVHPLVRERVIEVTA
ncbi:MAG: hypothetical protein EP330_05305 [Deltaproteobacteria bacterium]|nr:MAG: hypothetical protein EP330_05305 [Deltaproteobacteria bacterium]